jgi:hypothetical protein
MEVLMSKEPRPETPDAFNRESTEKTWRVEIVSSPIPSQGSGWRVIDLDEPHKFYGFPEHTLAVDFAFALAAKKRRPAD